MEQQRFLQDYQLILGKDKYPRVLAWCANQASEVFAQLSTSYANTPENMRREFLSRFGAFLAAQPAPPAAAPALTLPRTTMRIDQAAFGGMASCAVLVTRHGQEEVCGQALNSKASKDRGLCPRHYERFLRELDEEYRKSVDDTKNLKAAMSAKRMHLTIKEQALDRREKLDERLLELKKRDDEVTRKRARLDTEEQHKLAQEYADKLLRTEAGEALPEIDALNICDTMQ